MKRFNVHLPEPLLKRLRDDASTRDVKMSDIIRDALEEYYKKRPKASQDKE